MPGFLILRRIGKSGGKPLRVEGPSLAIGRDPGCGLALEDPLVAPRHAVIEWRGERAILRDEGSVTGTYVNDRPLEGEVALASGMRLLLGRVQVQVSIDPAREELTLSTIERTASADRAGALEAAARRRAPWRRPLVLGLAGLCAAILPFVALAALGRTGAFTRGPIHQKHRVDTRAGGVAPIRCEACHAPLGGVEPARCASCHAETVADGRPHPLSSASFARAGCAGCHDEHRGADAALIPAAIPPATCRACHAEAHRDEMASGVPRGARREERVIRFPSFSHAEHVVGRVGDCTKCHELVPPAARSGRRAASASAGAEGAFGVTLSSAPRGDFEPMGYETCVGCHEHERRKVEGHGTNTQCTACHAGPREKALATTLASIERAPLAAPPPQPHSLGAKECASCHMGAEEARAGRSAGRPFDHYAHLSTLAPEGPAEVHDVVAQCLECHAGISAAASVEAARAAPPAAECARCHTGAAIEQGTAPAPRTLAAVVFSHAAHVGEGRLGAPGAPLPGGTRRLSPGALRLHREGCLACHGFGKDAPGALPALGATPKDCAACHTIRHEDAGLAACAYCHRGPDDLFEPRRVTRPDTGPLRFDHASETHATLRCEECHADVPAATGTAALRFPRFASPECQRCHAARAGGDLDCAGCHKMHER